MNSLRHIGLLVGGAGLLCALACGCGVGAETASQQESGTNSVESGSKTSSATGTMQPDTESEVAGCASYKGPNPPVDEVRSTLVEMRNVSPEDTAGMISLESFPFDDAYALIQPGGVQWAANYNCDLVQKARDQGSTDPRAVGLTEWQLSNPTYMMAIGASGAAVACWDAKNDNGNPVQDPGHYFAVPLAVCPDAVPAQYR